MKGLADYRKLLKQAKSKTDESERKTAIKNVLSRYTNDQEILNQARSCSRSGNMRDIHKIFSLELEMRKELRGRSYRGLSEIEKVKQTLQDFDKDYENSVFAGYSTEASRRSNTLTSKDLQIQFTI